MTDPTPPAVWRIGELSRRLGVTDHVLRAWESRYGLLRPVRSAGGFRLYSQADLDRVRRMQAHLARGLSAAQAARVALDEERTARPSLPAVDPPVPAGAVPAGPAGADPVAAAVDRRDGLAGIGRALSAALDVFDEPAAQAMLDRLLGGFTVEAVLRDVVLPYLRRLGERWERGEASVAQEHFASNVIRGRLASLGRGWGHGHGPRAVLACAPGEQHDIALLAFGIVLNRNGWRIQYFGANTPVDDLVRMAEASGPDLVVVAASTPDRFEGSAEGLARLGRVAPLALAGAGGTAAIAAATGARLLSDDPVTAAERISVPSTRESSTTG